MAAEAIIGLAVQFVVAEGGLTPEAPEAPAAGGTGKAADGDGEAVDEGDERIVRHLGQNRLPQRFLDSPQIGGLARERGAVNPPQSGKQVAMVASEVINEGRVLVEPEELAHHLDGEDLTVGQDGVWAALP